MLRAHGFPAFNYRTDNWGANPSTAPGTSVTPGASNAEGSWTQIFGALSRDCYFLSFGVSGGGTSAQQKDHLLDIGVDEAGGTSYTAVASNIVCGYSSNPGQAMRFGVWYFFKAGSTVAVRVQGNNATAGTVTVCAEIFGDPRNPENCPVGHVIETIGAITSSQGVSFTPGASNAFGSWTSLGSTTRDLFGFQLGFQVSNAAMNAEQVFIELGHGDGTSGGTSTIQRRCFSISTAEVIIDVSSFGNLLWPAAIRPLPGGTSLYVRGACTAATPNTGYNANAWGFGG